MNGRTGKAGREHRQAGALHDRVGLDDQLVDLLGQLAGDAGSAAQVDAEPALLRLQRADPADEVVRDDLHVGIRGFVRVREATYSRRWVYGLVMPSFRARS